MNKSAFTLVEVLIAVMIIGIAIAALVGANGSLTLSNGAGIEMSTSEFLIEQIKELTATLPVVDPQSGAATFGNEETGVANYDDLDDFNGKTFSPPINSTRADLADFPNYSQQVTVQNLNPSDFNLTVANHSSDFVRITVNIFLNGRQISSSSWMRAKI